MDSPSGHLNSQLDSAATVQIEAAPRRPAYMFYVTSDTYACAALHLMGQLVHKVKMDRTRIELVVLHSPYVGPTMLARIQEAVQATLIPVGPILAEIEDSTWQDSLTKLLVFREWGYDRVVYLDADSVPMQNLDHLFELAPAPLYAPTAYWLPQPFFSSALMVIEPSTSRFDAMMKWARSQGAAAGFDMDILNSYFKDSVRHLPGEYTVLNSDFRAKPEAEKHCTRARPS